MYCSPIYLNFITYANMLFIRNYERDGSSVLGLASFLCLPWFQFFDYLKQPKTGTREGLGTELCSNIKLPVLPGENTYEHR